MNKTYYLLFIVTVLFFSTAGITQTQLGEDIDGENAGDESGISVSMSADGSRVVIGARYNENNTGGSGHARVYEYNVSSGWLQLGNDIDGEANGDESGYSVTMSADGSRVAIGAPNNDGIGPNGGHVRVYGFDVNNGWEQLGEDIDADSEKDRFGASMSLSADGSILAVGAPFNGAGSEGQVRVYSYNQSTGWESLGDGIVGGFLDQSGTSVSLSSDGSILAIGGPVSVGGDTGRGHVWVYKYDTNNGWEQLGSSIDGEGPNDGLGTSISLSADGTRMAVGAPGNQGIAGEKSGHVRVFFYDTTLGWQQLGEDIDGEAAFDRSGRSVSLSDDGSMVAIGAAANSGNGILSGHVRVYSYNNAAGWQLLETDIDGEAERDSSGASVSLSADGSRVAIGAPRNQDNGIGSGHVRIYSIGEVLSIDEITTNNGVSVYPNPTEETVHLEIPQTFGTTIQVTVVEAGSGKLVKNFTAIAGTNQVEFSGLANGVYILKIVSETASSTHRLILAK